MRTFTKHVYLYILLCGLSPFLSFSQNFNVNDSIFEKIDSTIRVAIVKRAFPGAVLYVMHKDSVIFHKAYGYHTYDSITAVMKDHIYDLASVTKVTAGVLSLMKLYDEGVIDLDAPVKQYIKGFNGNKRGNSTIREILAHQAGWRSWIPYYQDMRNNKGWKKKFFRNDSSENYPIKIANELYLTANYYKYIKRRIKKADFNPQQGYVYSGLFSYLIPEVIKTNTGIDFEEYLEKNFYEPLGSTTLGYNPLNSFPDSIIAPTEIDTFFRMEPIHGVVHDEGAVIMKGVSANAGLFSNAEDLAKIWKLFLNSGYSDTTKFLSPHTVDLFTTVQYPNNKNRRGLGFDKPLLEYDYDKSNVAKSASRRSYGHTGYTGPLVWVDPETELLFVFLCNRVYPSRNQTAIYELNIRPILHQYFYDLIKIESF